MDQPQPQPYVQQPQVLVMPVPERNGLGVFAFLVALIGLAIPTGVVSLLGLVLSLAAIGRAPRGFATFGVILGMIGSIFWLALTVVVVGVGIIAIIAMALVLAAGFMLTQPEVVEVTSDMVNMAIAVEEYEQEHHELPSELAALSLGVAATIDPWGGGYKLVRVDEEPGYDLVSGGPDGAFDTEDDVRLLGLDRFWEDAMAHFEQGMEDLGERLESIEAVSYDSSSCEWRTFHRAERADYERLARDEIRAERCSE
jgi:hypothetical protein